MPESFRRVERCVRGTRHPLQLYQNMAKDGARGVQTNSFYYRTVRPWNELPSQVVTADTLNSFKNRFDKFIETEHEHLKYHVVDTNDEED